MPDYRIDLDEPAYEEVKCAWQKCGAINQGRRGRMFLCSKCGTYSLVDRDGNTTVLPDNPPGHLRT